MDDKQIIDLYWARSENAITQAHEIQRIPQSKTDNLTCTIENLEPMRYNLVCCIGSFSRFFEKWVKNKR